MREQTHTFIGFLSAAILLFCTISLSAQEASIDNSVVSFKKRELTSGVVFDMNKETEELLGDGTAFNEEWTLLNAKFRFANSFWNLLDYKQEQFNAVFEVGPFGGYGNWEDNTSVGNTVADDNLYGIRASLNIAYLSRFYYDAKNYTVIDVNAWGRYDLFKQNFDGTNTDSYGVASPFSESHTSDRFRYGITAKAGWGLGRLSPMNHLMTAHYLLEKYYPGRVFSDFEIAQFAQVIANVKHSRNYKVVRKLDKEMDEIAFFIRNKLLLASPEAMAVEWQFSEFAPRYEGSRLELGPQFQYYNEDPDFVYGAYVEYDNAKYVNVRWNRNLSAGVTYSRYTNVNSEVINEVVTTQNENRDWATAEINLGWSYYSKLKSRFDFGVRYVPGIELNGFEDVGSLSNNVIPYLSYFTQLNAKSRIQFDFAWRIADEQQFVLSGPEFSLSIFRSRY